MFMIDVTTLKRVRNTMYWKLKKRRVKSIRQELRPRPFNEFSRQTILYIEFYNIKLVIFDW